jgi:uncharacterized protein
MTNTIMHFEIPADDVARAKSFYERAFGWKISDPWKMGYFFVETKKKGEEGINGGLLQRTTPGQPFMNYLTVASIDAACKKLEAVGGAVIMAKTEIGQQMGWIAAFKDTEGNIIGLHQAPPQAAAPRAQKKATKKKTKKKAGGRAKKKSKKKKSKKASKKTK